MSKNNYPQGQLDEINPVAVQQIVTSLKDLYDRGRPQTDAEVESRINEYFDFCEKSSIRPGVESLCMALHVSRTTLYNWANGIKCSPYRQELAEKAKGFVGAFIEQALLQGKISPPSGIFLAKNWLGYKDSISIEESIPNNYGERPQQSPEEIAERYREFAELPEEAD